MGAVRIVMACLRRLVSAFLRGANGCGWGEGLDSPEPEARLPSRCIRLRHRGGTAANVGPRERQRLADKAAEAGGGADLREDDRVNLQDRHKALLQIE